MDSGQGVPVNHVADLTAIAAAVRGQWFDLSSTLADPRQKELCLRLYAVRPEDFSTPRPSPTFDLLVRAVRGASVEDPGERSHRWLEFRDITYDAAQQSVTISSIPPLTIVLSVAAVNVRLLARA